MDYYRLLWSRVGGRPWTYIARDVYHKVEYLVFVTVFIGGYTVGHTSIVAWSWFLIIMAAYTVGYIHGHFFWGNPYIPGQKGS